MILNRLKHTLMCAALALGCGSSDTGTSFTDNYLSDAVDNVMPSFSAVEGLLRHKAPSAPRASTAEEWGSGNPLYEAFYLLRQFNPETDQGVIDTSNLYKTMWESRGFLKNTEGSCEEIAPTAITPPFDFGNDPVTYTCALNHEPADGRDFGGAFTRTGTRTDGLFGFVWQDPNHEEYGTMQAAYDEDTEDLALDIAVWVDYEGDNDYCYRNDIEGNAGTNYFNFRSVKGNRVAESAFTSMRGAGFSRGEGEFFLLRIANNAAPEGLYYCIGAEDGETQLMAMAAEGSQDVEESCEEFREAVDSMTMLDTDDLACRETDFNPGGRHEGSVLLEF